MYVKIKGNPKKVVEFIKDLNDVDAEVYLIVNDSKQVLGIIQKAVSEGLGIEIPPASITAPTTINSLSKKEEETLSYNEEEVLDNNSSELELLKKYKAKKKEKPAVKKVNDTEQRNNLEKPKKELKKEAEKEETAVIPTREKKKVQKTSETIYTKALDVVEKASEDEISFTELIKLKESAFSRKTVE